MNVKSKMESMHNRAYIYSKLTTLYLFGLAIVAGSFGTSVGISYFEATSTEKHVSILVFSMKIQTDVKRLVYAVREIVHTDVHMGVDMETNWVSKAMNSFGHVR